MTRALLTAALWAGFWALSLALVAALAWVPVAEARYEGGPGLSGFLAAAGALTLLWSLRPRGWFARSDEERRAPLRGPAGESLLAFVGDVAGKVAAPAAAGVVLSDHVNAHAFEHRRLLGLRRTREIGVGLPLFLALDREEMACVVAHELGHHAGGDLVLGPWVHRTRTSLAQVLGDLEGSSFFLDLPYRAYASLFLRVSARVSREQEVRADRISAAAATPLAAGRALCKVERLAALWEAYFACDAVPAINSGARVPLLEGFRRFLGESRRRPEVARAIEEMERRPPSRWDTHPPLEERLALLGCAPDAGVGLGNGCLDLLGGEAEAEDAWYAVATRGKLKKVGWDELGAEMILPAYAKGLASAPGWPDPGKAPLGTVDELLARGVALLQSLSPGGIDVLSEAAKRSRARAVIARWLAVALWRRGFAPEVRPGSWLCLRRGDLAVEPEPLVERLAGGDAEARAKIAGCEQMVDANVRAG